MTAVKPIRMLALLLGLGACTAGVWAADSAGYSKPGSRLAAWNEASAEALGEANGDEAGQPQLLPAANAKRTALPRSGSQTTAQQPPVQRTASYGQPTPPSYSANKYAPSSATRTASAAPSTRTANTNIQRPTQRVAQSIPNAYAYPNTPGGSYRPASRSMGGAPESVVAGSPVPGGAMYSDDMSGMPGQCNDCQDWGGGMSYGGRGGFFGGADFLYIRPTFSENTAYLQRTTSIDADENVTVTDRAVHHDFDYNGSIRAFLGYRFKCGGELRFTYWNYGADSSVNTGPATSDGSIIYIGQLEVVTQQPGQTIQVDSSLDMNVYDIDWSKCISFGGCNPCNPCDCCPPWALKYSAGIRVADVRRQNNNFLANASGAGARASFISGDFIGAGPRVGLEGRRFFHCGRTSLFARANAALLLGEFDIAETRVTPPSNPTLTENYFDSHARIIPVLDIELGGNWQVARSINLSAGYLFQAWWDLGAYENIQGNVFLSPVDDSNIMSFDGLFARAEICF